AVPAACMDTSSPQWPQRNELGPPWRPCCRWWRWSLDIGIPPGGRDERRRRRAPEGVPEDQGGKTIRKEADRRQGATRRPPPSRSSVTCSWVGRRGPPVPVAAADATTHDRSAQRWALRDTRF